MFFRYNTTMGILTIIATPIGNLSDISVRAMETLAEADYILAEDTRQFAKLKDHLERTQTNFLIKGVVIRFDEHAESLQAPKVIKWLNEGKKVALVSDAGTPLVSDPGFLLVRSLLSSTKHTVTSVPGPSAVTNALVLSGLPPYPYLFVGYLPRKSGKLNQLIKETLALNTNLPTTCIAYESPHRLVKTLETMVAMPEASKMSLVIMAEMTKQYERRLAGHPQEVLDRIISGDFETKGELVLLWRFATVSRTQPD